MSEPKEVTAALDSIARASTPARELAKQAIARHRRQSSSQPSQLSQQAIDSGGDTEERRRRFVSASVKFKRRSWWSWLLRR